MSKTDQVWECWIGVVRLVGDWASCKVTCRWSWTQIICLIYSAYWLLSHAVIWWLFAPCVVVWVGREEVRGFSPIPVSCGMHWHWSDRNPITLLDQIHMKGLEGLISGVEVNSLKWGRLKFCNKVIQYRRPEITVWNGTVNQETRGTTGGKKFQNQRESPCFWRQRTGDFWPCQ